MTMIEYMPWFVAPAEPVYVSYSSNGAEYVKLPLPEIHETTRDLTHDQQKLLSFIPSIGTGDRAKLCGLAGIASSTLRQWLWKSAQFRNCFYTLSAVELEELADFGQLHALMEVPGVVDRLIEFARQLKPELDNNNQLIWDKAPAMYAQLLAANDRILKMAGVDTNKEKDNKPETTIQFVLNQINANTERHVDIGGIAPLTVNYTVGD